MGFYDYTFLNKSRRRYYNNYMAKKTISIFQFQIIFFVLLIGTLGFCSIFFASSLSKYEKNHSLYSFSLEGEYIAENISITLNSLIYSLLGYSTADNMNAGHDMIIDQKLNTLLNAYPMVSSVYVTRFDGIVTYHTQGGSKKDYEINPRIQNAIFEVLEFFDKGDNRGTIIYINDPNLVKYENSSAFVVLQPIYQKSECELLDVEQSKFKCGKTDVLGFISVIVPFEKIKNTIKIPLYSSSIDWNHLEVSHVQKVGLDNIVKARSKEFAQKGNEPFLVEHKILVKNPFFENGVTFYVTLSSYKNFLEKAKEKIHIMFFIYAGVMLGIVVIFIIGIVLTGRAFNKIRTMIDSNQIDKDEYTFTPAWLTEVVKVDKTLYAFWTRMHTQLTTIQEQSEQLKEYRNKLEDRNKDLTNQVNAQLIELNKSMQVKSDMLTSYRVVLEMSEYLYAQHRDIEDVTEEVRKSLTKLNIGHRFCFKIAFGKDEVRHYFSPGLKHHFSKEYEIDYTKYYYIDQINDQDCFLVYPVKTLFGGNCWLCIELLNNVNIPTSKIESLALFCKVISSCIDNIAMSLHMEMLANKDQLTMLFNRNAYIEKRRVLFTQDEQQIGLFLVDINGLKEINDTFGHNAGDWLISECATILKKIAAGKDMLVYRLGGDEFGLLTMNPSDELVEEIIGLFKAEMEIVRDFGENGYQISFSYGYSSGSSHDLDGIFSKADATLYEYKKNYYKDKRDRRNRSRVVM